MTSRHYHWIPDGKDPRDFTYSRRLNENSLPPSVDLSSQCSPIENQGQIGSCTAHALIGNMEFLEKRASRVFRRLSRLFVYYNERQIEGDPNQDHGAQLRDGIKSLKNWGVCDETLWPYEESLVLKKPVTPAFKAAVVNRITKYERMRSLADMRDCLASGFPFVFGFVVYPSFESIDVSRTGIAQMPAAGEKPLGGHAVLAVGYDDSTKRMRLKNSWGAQWGDQGYFTLPYEYLTGGLAGDFWSIEK